MSLTNDFVQSLTLEDIRANSYLGELTSGQVEFLGESIIAQLTADELLGLNADGVSILDCLTVTQFGALTGAQLNAKDASGNYILLSKLTDSQIGLLSGESVAGLDAAALASRNADGHSIVSQLIAAQVLFLTSSQLNAKDVSGNYILVSQLVDSVTYWLSNKAVAGLDVAALLSLNASGHSILSQLQDFRFGDLTSSQLNEKDASGNYILLSKLTDAQIGTLSMKALAGLDAAALLSLNADGHSVFSLLSKTQFGALTGAQLNAKDASGNYILLSKLTDAQIGSLSMTALAGLDAAALVSRNADGHSVFSLLSKTQFGALTGAQLNAKDASGNYILLSKLTDAQIGSLWTEGLSGMDPAALLSQNADGHSVLSQLSATQLGALTSSQLNAKDASGNYILLSKLTDSQIASLSPYDLSGLDVAALASQNADSHSVVSLLSQTQLGALTGAQLNAVDVTGKYILLPMLKASQISQDRLWGLSNYQIQSLSTEAIAGLGVATILGKTVYGHRVLSVLTEDQLGALTKTQLSATAFGFDCALLRKMTRDQFKCLSTSSIPARGLGVTLATGELVINCLDSAQVNALATEILDAVFVLGPRRVSALELLTYRQLSVSFLGKLSDSKVRSLSNPALAGLSGAALASLNADGHSVVSLLSATQFGALTSAQLNAKDASGNYILLSKLTDSQIGSLSTDAVSGLDVAALLSQDSNAHSVLSQLSATQLGALTGTQLDAKDVTGKYILLPNLTSGQLNLKDASGKYILLSKLTDSQIGSLSLTALAGLSAAALVSRNADRHSVVSLLSATQLGALTSAQLNAKDASGKYILLPNLTSDQLNLKDVSGKYILLSKLTDLQIGSLSTGAVSGLDVAALLSQDSNAHSVLSQLSATQLGALTGAQLNAKDASGNYILLPVLTRAQVGSLSNLSVHYLEYDDLISTVSDGSTVLSCLSRSQIGALNTRNDAVRSMSAYDLQSFTSDGSIILSALNDEQIGLLDPAAVAGLSAALLVANNANGNTVVSKLGVKRIAALTDLQLQEKDRAGNYILLPNLSDVQVASLSSRSVAGLDDVAVLRLLSLDGHTVLSQLSFSAVCAISSSLISDLTTDELLSKSSIGYSILSILTVTQLSGLTGTQLNKKDASGKYILLSKLADSQIRSLSTTAVSGLDVAAFASLNLDGHSVVSQLSAAQLGALTSAQLNSKDASGNYILTPQLEDRQVRYLSLTAIAGFTVDALMSGTASGRSILSQLSATQLSGLTSEQINEKDASGNYILLSNLTGSKIGSLSNAVIAALDVSVFLTLNVQKQMILALISSEQFLAWIDSNTLSSLAALMSSLADAQLRVLTSAQLNVKDASGNYILLSKLTDLKIGSLSTKALAGLDTAALASLNADSHSVVSQLSATQLGALTSAQLNAKDASGNFILLSKLTDSQIGSLSTDAVSGLDVAALLSQDSNAHSVLSQLSATQLGALTGTQLDAKDVTGKYILLPNLTSGQLNLKDASGKYILLSKLTDLQIGSLSATVLAGLDAAALVSQNADSHSVVSQLSATQLGALTSAQLNAKDVTGKYILLPNLTSDQLNLKDASGKYILLSKLTDSQIGSLSTYAVSGLDVAALLSQDSNVHSVLSQLSATQLGALTGTQLNAKDVTGKYLLLLNLTSDQLNLKDASGKYVLLSKLTDAQIGSLSLTALAGLSAAALVSHNADSHSVVSQLSATQFGALTSAQLNAKDASGNYILLSQLTDSQIVSLSDKSVAGLDAAALASLNADSHSVVSQLSATQFGALTGTQLNAKDASGKYILLSKLTDSQIGSLSTYAVSGLDVAALLSQDSNVHSVLSQLSATQLGALTGTQLNAKDVTGKYLLLLNLTSDQLNLKDASGKYILLSKLTDSQIGSLSTDAVSGLAVAALLSQDSNAHSVLSQLSATQLGALTRTQLDAKDVTGKYILLPNLTSGQLNLKDASGKYILLSKLTDLQIRTLSATVLAGLDAAALVSQNADSHSVVSQLSATQLGALTSAQLNAKDASGNYILLSKLTDSQIVSLSNKSVAGLDAAALVSRNANGHSIVSQLSSDQLNSLTALQLQSVGLIDANGNYYYTSRPISQWTSAELRSAGLTIGLILLPKLTDIQVQALSPSVISALSRTQLFTVDKDGHYIISQLTDEQTKAIGSSTLSGMVASSLLMLNSDGHTIFSQLTSKQLQALTISQLGEMNALGKYILTPFLTSDQLNLKDSAGVYFLLSKLTDKQIAELSTLVISGLDAAALVAEDSNAHSIFTQLSAAQLGALTSTQLRAKDADGNYILLSKLSDTQVASLSGTAISELGSDDLLSYDSHRKVILSSLTDYQLSFLTYDQLFAQDLNGKLLISYLSATKINALDSSVISSLDSSTLQILYDSHSTILHDLNEFQSTHLNVSELTEYTNVGYLIEMMSGNQFKYWDRTKLMSLDSSGTKRAINYMSESQIQGVEDINFRDFTESDLSLLDYNGHFVLDDLSAEQVDELNVKELTTSLIQNHLSQDQIQGFTVDQLRLIDKSGNCFVNDLTQTQRSWLSEAQRTGVADLLS